MHDFLEQCHTECVLCDSVFAVIFFHKDALRFSVCDISAFGPGR